MTNEEWERGWKAAMVVVIGCFILVVCITTGIGRWLENVWKTWVPVRF